MMRLFLALMIIFAALIPPTASCEEVRRDEEYRICPNDLLDIGVYEEADLCKVVKVSGDGVISFPLVGDVVVAGLTPQEAAKKLTELLAQDYLVNPQVSVMVKEHVKINVLGQVMKPGAYELTDGLTVVGAIALAGGFSELASGNGTKVIRVRGGKKEMIRVPVDSILKSGNASRDILLEPNDTVVVPESIF
jgi:polysaccharide export outer membrane protein